MITGIDPTIIMIDDRRMFDGQTRFDKQKIDRKFRCDLTRAIMQRIMIIVRLNIMHRLIQLVKPFLIGRSIEISTQDQDLT